VSLATLTNEGPPQVQPVWCNFDGTHILINTEKDRQKYRNMSRRPSVTILEGAFEHVDELARHYLGVDKYLFHEEGDVRVIFKVVPTRVATIESTMPDLSAST
jgi:hypothetical protein